MEVRMTSSQVTFLWPFRLNGFDDIQAPGTYTVTVEKERLDSLTVQGWRQTSATFRLPHNGVVEHVAIDMADLSAALMHDRDPQMGPPVAPFAPSTNPAKTREVLHLRARRT
jgi:hypothetical protein